MPARHDYLPFGEEVAANTFGRNGPWGSGSDSINQKFTAKSGIRSRIWIISNTGCMQSRWAVGCRPIRRGLLMLIEETNRVSISTTTSVIARSLEPISMVFAGRDFNGRAMPYSPLTMALMDSASRQMQALIESKIMPTTCFVTTE
jgi:hypothetical protein